MKGMQTERSQTGPGTEPSHPNSSRSRVSTFPATSPAQKATGPGPADTMQSAPRGSWAKAQSPRAEDEDMGTRIPWPWQPADSIIELGLNSKLCLQSSG